MVEMSYFTAKDFNMKTTLLYLLMFMWQPAEVTAYCPCEHCCGTGSPGITANGYQIQPGDEFVAAPRNIPFGTKIFVPGYGWSEVKDRGGAIKTGRIDLFFATHQEALNWGRVHTNIIVVETK